jgi:hypothetical protein
MTICPGHRSNLGIGWRRRSKLCCVPQAISSHCSENKNIPTAQRGISLPFSIKILELAEELIPIGSGKESMLLSYTGYYWHFNVKTAYISRKLEDFVLADIKARTCLIGGHTKIGRVF